MVSPGYIPRHNIPGCFDVISSLPFDVFKFTTLPLYGFRYAKNALMCYVKDAFKYILKFQCFINTTCTFWLGNSTLP